MSGSARTTAVLIAALSLATAMPRPASAEPADEPATSVEQCLQQLAALVEEAHAAQLLDDQIDEAETLVKTIEARCLAADFASAAMAAAQVRAILATNK